MQAVVEADTAGSAQMVAERGDTADAAIASALAAELYGLDVLRANVEDSRDNTTRFYIAARRRAEAAGCGDHADDLRLPRAQRAGGACTSAWAGSPPTA